LAKSLPKTWGEPPPNGGVISSQRRLVNSEFKAYRKERHDAHDKNPYHAHDRPEAWRGTGTGTTATGNWAGGCASAGARGLTQAALQAIRTDVFNVAAPVAP
jgi:hypothetical protein